MPSPTFPSPVYRIRRHKRKPRGRSTKLKNIRTDFRNPIQLFRSLDEIRLPQLMDDDDYIGSWRRHGVPYPSLLAPLQAQHDEPDQLVCFWVEVCDKLINIWTEPGCFGCLRVGPLKDTLPVPRSFGGLVLTAGFSDVCVNGPSAKKR